MNESETMQTRRRSIRTNMAALFVVLAVLAAGCAGGSSGTRDDQPTIVVSTTIWGDVVSNLVGDRATVEVLMPIGADPHEFQLSSRQIAAVQSADLVVVNGLGLEAGMHDALEAAEADGANVLEVGPSMDPIPFGGAEGEVCDPDGEHDHDGDGGVSHDESLPACDPHVWMDPQRVAIAVGLIVDRLGALDGDVDWQAVEDRYLTEIADVDADMEEILTAVQPGDRELVTNHESLGYLAERYGYEVVATVIPGGTTLGSASSSEIAELVATMEARDIRVIFADTSSPDDLAEAVGAELGGEVVVVELFTGSLGDAESGADTLTGLWLTNAKRIASALGG